MAGLPAMRSVTSPIVVPGPNSLIPDLRYTYPPSFRRRPEWAQGEGRGGATFECVGKRPTSPSTHANVIAMKTNCNGPIPSVRHRVGNRAPAPGLRPAPERRWKDGRIFIVLRGLRKATVILSEVEESKPLMPDPPHTVVPAQAGTQGCGGATIGGPGSSSVMTTNRTRGAIRKYGPSPASALTA